MFRSRILKLTLHPNTDSKIASITLIKPRPMSNLKRQNLTSVMSNIYSKNCETVRNDLAEAIFPTAVNPSSLNSHENETTVRNTSNIRRIERLLTSKNYVSTRCNALSRTSTFLLPKHNSVSSLCTKPLGVRHMSGEATHYVPRIQLTGIWKDLSESAPVEFIQETLISFQSTTHLPWWATIVLTTFIVRSTMTLPLSLYQHYILAKVQNLHGEMNEVIDKLKMEANIAVSHHGWTEQYARMIYERTLKKKWNELIEKENCHPAKGLIVLWTQIPLWITISSALRNLCYMLPPSHENAEKVFMELTTGGFGWFVNLIEVDHYWILPISVGIFNLANIEIMALMKVKEDTRLQKYLLYFLRFISLAMVPIGTYVPTCICLYWASSSAFGLMQNLLLLSPTVRRLGGVPLTSTERANPYRDLIQKFRAKKYINFSRTSTNVK